VRRWAVVAISACAGLAAGCGNSRTPVPAPTRPAVVGGFRTLTFPANGVSVSVPRSWAVIPQRALQLAEVASGRAVIALWRYPRAEVPPASAAALATARAALFNAVRTRQPSVRIVGSRLARIEGAPVIEFDAVERIGGQLRQVLSTHLFEPGGELVLEEYAPPGLFTAIRHSVLARVRASLAIMGPAG
jgi:hypothetical protein